MLPPSLLLITVLFPFVLFSQNLGDYRSKISGSWQTASTWEEFSSSGWINANSTPNSPTLSVTIQSGHYVQIPTSGRSVKDLTVETGAILRRNGAGYNYINLYGNLTCNGLLGRTSALGSDSISINLFGLNSTFSGSGSCFISRLRKNNNFFPTTYLIIDADVFVTNPEDGLYCDLAGGAVLDIAVNYGKTLTVRNNLSPDGIDGTGGFATSMNIAVSGNLCVENILYLKTNNGTVPSYFTINNGGNLIVGNFIEGIGASGGSANIFLTLNSGASMDLRGPKASSGLPVSNLHSTRNIFNLNLNSKVEYSHHLGIGYYAVVEGDFGNYGHLTISGSGSKILEKDIVVSGHLTIKNGTLLDVTGANYQISMGGNWLNENQGSNDGFLQELGRILLNGNSPQTITKSGGTEIFHDVSVQNNSGVILNSSLSISGILSLVNGNIGTSWDKILTLLSGASWNGGGTGSYINGPMEIEVFTAAEVVFPLGKSGEYGKAAITPTQNDSRGAATRRYRAEYFVLSPGNESRVSGNIKQISHKEFWEISERSGANGNDDDAALKLFWTSRSSVSSNQSARDSLRVVGWDSASSIWKEEGNILPATGHSTQTGNVCSGQISAFVSPFKFTIGSRDLGNPLPVTLVKLGLFDLSNTEMAVYWETATEVNNKGFFIFRSKNGFEFVESDFIWGRGNSNEISRYQSILKKDLESDQEFFKLVQVDFNGTENEFPVLIYRKKGPNEIVVLGNGTQSPRIVLPFSSPDLSNLELYNGLLKKENIRIFEQTEMGKIKINPDGILSPGIYWILIPNDKPVKICIGK